MSKYYTLTLYSYYANWIDTKNFIRFPIVSSVQNREKNLPNILKFNSYNKILNLSTIKNYIILKYY